MVEDRRQHARLTPKPPVFVCFDDVKGGLLLDVCEGGVAMATLVPRNLDDVVSLAFDLPEGTGHIEARAAVMWTRNSGHLAGLRFVDLDDSSRQQLGLWLGAASPQSMAFEQPVEPAVPEPSEPVIVTRSTYAQADADPQDGSDPSVVHIRAALQQPREPDAEEAQILSDTGLSGAGKSRHTIELILAVVLLSWALVFLGYQMGSTGISRERAKEAAAELKRSELAAKTLVQSVEASAVPTKPAEASALSVGDAGTVLQVGAMKLEENAESLAQELQKKNFPAFTFRHGQEGLYRVAVGPYSDEESATKVKDTLEKQGFKPILRHWLPE
jgi:septal ring-binding cell division protein DamX